MYKYIMYKCINSI